MTSHITLFVTKSVKDNPSCQFLELVIVMIMLERFIAKPISRGNPPLETHIILKILYTVYQYLITSHNVPN